MFTRVFLKWRETREHVEGGGEEGYIYVRSACTCSPLFSLTLSLSSQAVVELKM